jgi:hypothetical protein
MFYFGGVILSTTGFPHFICFIPVKFESDRVSRGKGTLSMFNHAFEIFSDPWWVVTVEDDSFFRHDVI